MWRAERGQASSEMLLVALFALVMAFFILNAWFSVSDETQAILLFKTKTVELLNKADDFYALRKVEVESSTVSNLTLKSFVTPDFVQKEPTLASDLEKGFPEIAKAIEDKTKYSYVELKVNDKTYNRNGEVLFWIEIPVETVCDDGIDNDGDGLTDMDDPDCWGGWWFI